MNIHKIILRGVVKHLSAPLQEHQLYLAPRTTQRWKVRMVGTDVKLLDCYAFCRDGALVLSFKWSKHRSQHVYELADPEFLQNLADDVIKIAKSRISSKTSEPSSPYHYPIPTIRQKDMGVHKLLVKGIIEQLQDAVLENYSNMVLRPTYIIDPSDWRFRARWEFVTIIGDEVIQPHTINVYISHGYLILKYSIISTSYELADPAFPQNLIANIIRSLEKFMLVE